MYNIAQLSELGIGRVRVSESPQLRDQLVSKKTPDFSRQQRGSDEVVIYLFCSRHVYMSHVELLFVMPKIPK